MSTKCLIFLCLMLASCHGNPVDTIGEVEKLPAGSTIYDQRQTGKYNLHVNIKDVQFFSLSDSLAGIGGDYGDYEGDYSDILGIGGTDGDYDNSHLTVNPIFAFLGNKPITKPTTTTTAATTEKAPQTSSGSTTDSTNNNTTQEDSTEKASETVIKQESESEIKDPAANKPVEDKKPQQPIIDYEEIPVEVLYFRGNQQKTPTNGRTAVINRYYKKQPSVQILGESHGRTKNVQIIENDQAQSGLVKICNRGEFRDAQGRCRVRARRGVPGL